MKQQLPQNAIFDLKDEFGETVPLRLSCRDGKIEIDFDQLVRGTYILNVTHGEEVESTKVIID